jgi:Uma2 family endonuclease
MSAIPASEPELVMTEAEYLAFEEASDTKHEFVDGYVYDWPGYDYDAEGLAGTRLPHNRLQVNLLTNLAAPAAAAGCQVVGSDLRLYVRLLRRGRTTRRYYYPDAMVLCDQELREDEGDDEMHVTRPCVIIEILSGRSGRIDHTEKLEIYQGIPSVQAYLIVHQRQQRVERQWRDADGTWQMEVITSGSVPIPCIGLDLALDAIYADVE